MANGVGNYIRHQDAFGQPININFHGNDTYQTIPGGMISIVMVLLLVGYTFLKLKYMINHEEWKLNNQTVMAERLELNSALNFSSFPNVSIGLQFSSKPQILTKEMKELQEKAAKDKQNEQDQ